MSFLTVPNAQPPAIDDRLLAHLRAIAHDAPQSNATHAEAEWLLSVAGPLLDELATRRAAMAQMLRLIRVEAPTLADSAADLTNVVVMSAVRQ